MLGLEKISGMLSGGAVEPRRPGEGSGEGRSGSTGAAAGQGVRDPEVVAVAKRRRFSRAYKLRIVEEADHCKRLGEVGMLLRREGLHSSHLVAWRRLRREAARKASETKRGRRPAPVTPLAAEVARLRGENARLQLRLRKAEGLLEVQKKLAAILESEPSGSSEKSGERRS